MINKFFKTGLIFGNLALSLAILAVKSSQAAEFTLNFGLGSGKLSFEESPLTAIGRESITLADLYNYCQNFACQESPQFNYQISFVPTFNLAPEEITLQGYALEDITFEFNSGNLVGISLFQSDQEAYSFGGFEGELPEELLGINYLGFAGITLDRDQYSYSVSVYSEPYGIVNEYDEFGNIIYSYIDDIEEFVDGEFFEQSGTIQFNTVEPIEAIPEPSLTFLGAMSALGFAQLCKRKLTKN
jgi:hypothetical protein